MGLLLSKHQTIMLTCAILLLIRKIYYSRAAQLKHKVAIAK